MSGIAVLLLSTSRICTKSVLEFREYGDLGVFLDAVEEIFEFGVVVEVFKLSRNPADKEFGFIAAGSGYPNM